MPSQRGAGRAGRERSAARSAASRARLAVRSAARTEKKQDDAVWTAIANTLDPATVARIAALVDRQARERRAPSKHPGVQELRAALSGKTVPPSLPNTYTEEANLRGMWTASVGDCKLMMLVGLPRETGARSVSLRMMPSDGEWYNAFAEFHWNSGDGLDGARIYTNNGLTPEKERLFYAALSVVLPRLAVHSEDIAAAVPTMKAYVYKRGAGEHGVVKTTTTVAARVRKLYGSAGGRGGAGAAGAHSVRRGA